MRFVHALIASVGLLSAPLALGHCALGTSLKDLVGHLIWPVEARIGAARLELLRLYKNDDDFYFWLLKQEPEALKRAISEPEQLLKTWKENRARSVSWSREPWFADLSPSTRNTETPVGSKIDQLVLLAQRFDRDQTISLYESRVVRLRSGDRVTFGDGKTFRLGRFLGRGNATHVYELADQPGHVIRIPFLSSFLPLSFDVAKRAGDTRELATKYVQNWEALKKTGVNIVELLDYPQDYSYVIVSKIDGKVTGKDYLKRLGFGRTAPTLQEIERLPDPEARNRLRSLREQCLLIGSPEEIERQFVWDEKRKIWVLGDWDDPPGIPNPFSRGTLTAEPRGRRSP